MKYQSVLTCLLSDCGYFDVLTLNS